MALDGVVPYPEEFATHYRERGYWRGLSMDQVFGELFERHGERPALLFNDEVIGYRQLGRRRLALAAHLHRLGIRRLDRVVVHLPNHPRFLVLYFALQRIGAIPILALAGHRRAEIEHFVRLADAVAYVGPDLEMAAEVRRANPCLRWLIAPEELDQGEAEGAPAARVDPSDPCVLLLSGGTTGIPKLIPRTHDDYLYNSRAAAAVQDVGPDSCQIAVAPLAHNMPLACPGVQGFLLHGARVALSPGTRAADVLPLIERHRVTHVAAVPALYLRWLADPELGRHDLSSVRLVQSGGQRLQPEVRRRLAHAFPNAFVQENFGMSEGMLFFVRRDDPPEAQLETVGRPISPDDEVRLLDGDREVPDGEAGELAVRGPYTIRGYYRAPEHNARVFTGDGFYRTGDVMRRHPSGNYLVEGRIKDLINRGGEKISAEEVENLILTHPAVREVACVPYPDPVLGERMCACVVLHAGCDLTLDGLCAHLLGRGIAKFKLPERLELLPSLPLSAFGKVAKQLLAERLAGHETTGSTR
jgi:2,3-dihydroxybenzoate-AMP ligase